MVNYAVLRTKGILAQPIPADTNVLTQLFYHLKDISFEIFRCWRIGTRRGALPYIHALKDMVLRQLLDK